MGSFSIWHWLIVLVIVILIFGQAKLSARGISEDVGGNLVHSITAYVVAALHDGKLSTQWTIDRLDDRHRAKLPELGIDTTRILKEAKSARTRNHVFGFIYLIPSIWLVGKLLFIPSPDEFETELTPFVVGLMMPLLVIVAISIAKALIINRYLLKNVIKTDSPIEINFSENVIIFGGFSPFAGFGNDLDSWSFTIDTTQSVEHSGRAPEPFTQQALIDFVASQIKKNIKGAIKADLSFISGRHIRWDARFLSSHTATPNSRIAEEQINAEIGRPDSTWRHYRSLTIPIAEGHLALSFFLRSTKIGKNAFIESRCFILTPVKPEYTSLNDLPARSGIRYLLRLFRSKVLLSPFSWIAGSLQAMDAVGKGFHYLSLALFGDPEDRLKLRDVSYNYGNTNSFREMIASNTYQTYFQLIDKDRIAKTVQYITLNSIVDFLDAHGVATDEIKERKTQIFNSGVIVSGGVVNAQQMAVGSRAKARMSGATAMFKSKGGSDVK